MADENKFKGLARGPIDHAASAVINAIATEPMTMGSAVKLAVAGTGEILPRVALVDTDGDVTYGIVIGGDADGVYGDDGQDAASDINRAATAAGQAVVVCVRGRCVARVQADDDEGNGTAIAIGDALAAGVPDTGDTGLLVAVDKATNFICARALQAIDTTGDSDLIAVDLQREGLFT